MLYLAVPDKRFTFDKDRPVTLISHLQQDHDNGPACPGCSILTNGYVSSIRFHEENAVQERLKALMDKDYSIHFHVWTQLDFLEFLLSLRDRLRYDIETTFKQASEFVIVLRKIGQDC